MCVEHVGPVVVFAIPEIAPAGRQDAGAVVLSPCQAVEIDGVGYGIGVAGIHYDDHLLGVGAIEVACDIGDGVHPAIQVVDSALPIVRGGAGQPCRHHGGVPRVGQVAVRTAVESGRQCHPPTGVGAVRPSEDCLWRLVVVGYAHAVEVVACRVGTEEPHMDALSGISG